MSVIVYSGRLPRWLPEYRLIEAVAPMRRIADRHGGDIVIETNGDTVHVSCVTPDGIRCLQCGAALERVRRVRRFGAKHDVTRSVLFSFCDACGGAL